MRIGLFCSRVSSLYSIKAAQLDSDLQLGSSPPGQMLPVERFSRAACPSSHRLQVIGLWPNPQWLKRTNQRPLLRGSTGRQPTGGTAVMDRWFIQSAAKDFFFKVPFPNSFKRTTSQMVLCNKPSVEAALESKTTRLSVELWCHIASPGH